MKQFVLEGVEEYGKDMRRQCVEVTTPAVSVSLVTLMVIG